MDINKNIFKERENRKIKDQEQTSIMPSLVAIETISAHETTPGQAFSSSSLMKSILLKPSRSEMVFITIVVIKKDRSTITLIKKSPQKIKTNKLVPKNKWQEIRHQK